MPTCSSPCHALRSGLRPSPTIRSAAQRSGTSGQGLWSWEWGNSRRRTGVKARLRRAIAPFAAIWIAYTVTDLVSWRS